MTISELDNKEVKNVEFLSILSTHQSDGESFDYTTGHMSSPQYCSKQFGKINIHRISRTIYCTAQDSYAG